MEIAATLGNVFVVNTRHALHLAMAPLHLDAFNFCRTSLVSISRVCKAFQVPKRAATCHFGLHLPVDRCGHLANAQFWTKAGDAEIFDHVVPSAQDLLYAHTPENDEARRA
jgi:hypothetical protein